MTSAHDHDTRSGPGGVGLLEQSLGWGSLALGVPQTLAPRAFARAIGAPDGPRTTAVLLTLCGPRELGAAAGILWLERPWPSRTVASRVLGDVLDVGLLVVAARSSPRSRVRLAAAGGVALALGTADLLALIRAPEQADGDRAPATFVDHPMLRGKAITIRLPREELEARWTAWEGPAGALPALFADAPGDRGTELRIDLGHDRGPRAALEAARRLRGRSRDQRIADDLRRFKQVVETGQVTRSDGTPGGTSTAATRSQHPARPVADAPTGTEAAAATASTITETTTTGSTA